MEGGGGDVELGVGGGVVGGVVVAISDDSRSGRQTNGGEAVW
jgi:hypothetical protein